MKAVEYFEKYKELISNKNEEISREGVINLVMDLSRELNDLLDKKNIKTDHGVIGAVKEQNSKWNAMIPMFEKEFGQPILARNGFNKYIVSILPETEKSLPT